jgi:hypothetical protein
MTKELNNDKNHEGHEIINEFNIDNFVLLTKRFLIYPQKYFFQCKKCKEVFVYVKNTKGEFIIEKSE